MLTAGILASGTLLLTNSVYGSPVESLDVTLDTIHHVTLCDGVAFSGDCAWMNVKAFSCHKVRAMEYNSVMPMDGNFSIQFYDGDCSLDRRVSLPIRWPGESFLDLERHSADHFLAIVEV